MAANLGARGAGEVISWSKVIGPRTWTKDHMTVSTFAVSALPFSKCNPNVQSVALLLSEIIIHSIFLNLHPTIHTDQKSEPKNPHPSKSLLGTVQQ